MIHKKNSFVVMKNIYQKNWNIHHNNILWPQVHQQEPSAAGDWAQVRRILHEPPGGDEEN